MPARAKKLIAYGFLGIILIICAIAILFMVFGVGYGVIGDLFSPDINWEEVFDRLWHTGVSVGLIFISYFAGKYFVRDYLNPKSWFSLIYIVLCIIALSWLIAAGISRNLGTHVEDDDPLRGGGQRVIDRYVSRRERQTLLAENFILLLLPALSALYKVREEKLKELNSKVVVDADNVL